jgi:hypothetical protein
MTTTTMTMTDTDALALAPEMLLGLPDHQIATAKATVPSRKARWAGRIVSGLAVLFLAFDCTIKLLQLAPAMSGTSQLGYPTSAVLGIGIVELLCLAVYLIPRTSVLGAILLTGYLGGAIATHVRAGSPLATHVLFPIYVAALIWGGLFLRDLRVRALVRAAP